MLFRSLFDPVVVPIFVRSGGVPGTARFRYELTRLDSVDQCCPTCGLHAARGLILNGPPELAKVLLFEYQKYVKTQSLAFQNS